MDPDGSYVVKPVDEHLVELQRSHVPMDHYNFPRDRQVGNHLCYAVFLYGLVSVSRDGAIDTVLNQ